MKEPEIIVEPVAMKVNKLDLAWLKENGLSVSEAVSALESFIFEFFSPSDKITVAGHNVSFDLSFLKRMYSLAEFPFPEFFSHRVLDTSSIVGFLSLAGLLPLMDAGSSEIFRFFQICIGKDERHTALGDAQATAVLMTRLLKLTEERLRITD